MITDDTARTLSAEPPHEPERLYSYINDEHRRIRLPRDVTSPSRYR